MISGRSVVITANSPYVLTTCSGASQPKTTPMGSGARPMNSATSSKPLSRITVQATTVNARRRHSDVSCRAKPSTARAKSTRAKTLQRTREEHEAEQEPAEEPHDDSRWGIDKNGQKAGFKQ